MNFRPEDFRPALEEARRLVKDTPPAEVPHSLRRTRGSSSRRMTPVEARTLFRELDRDEVLRRATLDRWGPPPLSDSDPRTAASVLFLERSANWESQARGHLAEVALEESRAEVDRLIRLESDARAEIRSLRHQAEDVRRRADAETRRRTEDLNQDLARARERITKLETELAEQGRQKGYWKREANAAWDDLDLADRRYDDLRERHGSKRSSSVSPGGPGAADITFRRDPLEAARMLDQMMSFWQVGPDSTPAPAAPEVRLGLPSGVDPRSGEAVKWVFFDAPRSTLVVDGWNVAYYWNYHRKVSEDPDQGTVEFVTNKLDKLARYSVGGHRVSFFLDSRYADGIAADWENRFQSGRLTGYYVENADDAIAEEATRRAGEPVVVITSDKELASRCRVHGAMVVASEGLAEWMAESPV